MFDRLVDEANARLEHRDREFKERVPKRVEDGTARFKQKMSNIPCHCGKLHKDGGHC
jgi:hypothetical protein